jgi:hypothetical protein
MYNICPINVQYESGLFVNGELVRCLQHIRIIARTEDLLLVALPLRLVNGIDPVLNLHDDAAVLLNNARSLAVPEEALGVLQGESS